MRRKANSLRFHRRGISLLEILVVFTVIGILFALLLPAVQSARETSRRVECVNHLKQIGVAAQNCASGKGFFPSSGDAYDQLMVGLGYGPRAERHRILDFRCPSDSWSASEEASLSYVKNAGTRFRGGDDYRNGYELMRRDREPSDFTDGMSHTAAFSERLAIRYSTMSDADVSGNSKRFLWWTSAAVSRLPGNEPLFTDACRETRTSQLPARFFYPDIPFNGYDHFLTPNQPGCWNGTLDDYIDDPRNIFAIAPASSQHRGGVNVLFVDGHVTFIVNEIDHAVWQAIGTVNGGESASSEL